MKSLLLQLALHHEWAAKLISHRLAELPEEVLNRNMDSSFGSINRTVYHLVVAGNIWWQRIQLQERIVYPDEKLASDFPAMAGELMRLAAFWVDLVSDAAENRLQHVFEYRNTKSEAFKQPLSDVLLHIFNHQTYHFGQIVTMMRQQHVDRIPATDFIEFLRRRGRRL